MLVPEARQYVRIELSGGLRKSPSSRTAKRALLCASGRRFPRLSSGRSSCSAGLEVGLGGKYDATNIVARPRLTIITPIGLDHAEFLGNSPAEIAAITSSLPMPR